MAWIAFGLILLAGPAAKAQGGGAPRVEVEVDRDHVAVGEPFWVTIRVTSSEGGVSVSLPPGAPFEIVGRGGTMSSFQMSTSFGGGMQVTRQETFRWQLRATAQGRQRIGPMVVRVGGRQYRMGMATIDVGPPGSGSSPPSGGQQAPSFPGLPLPGGAPFPPGGPYPGGAVPPGGIPGQIDPGDLTGAAPDRDLFLRTVVEPAEAWVGQEVVATIYLYTTVQLANVNVTQEASTEGFWSEDMLGPTRRLRFEDQFVGQQHYRVAVLRKMALFPLRAGTLTIGAPRVEATTAFRSFFSPRAGTLVREGVPVAIRVRALPEKGRPRGFHPGNVGELDIEATLDRSKVKVGEPVTLTVTVSGTGKLQSVRIPPLGEIEGARVYEPNVDESVGPRGDKLGGEKRWSFLIMPQKVGRLEIPSVRLDYFDPVTGTYRSKSTAALTVEVSAGRSSTSGAGDAASGNEGGGEGTAEGQGELGPLHAISRHSALVRRRSAAYERWWFWALLLLAPGGYVLVVVVEAIRRHRGATAGVQRSRRAARRAKERLREAASREPEERLGEVLRAINGFFMDRFGLSAAGQTTEELRAFLMERGATAELASSTAEVVERCERGRFGGEEIDVNEVIDEARRLIEQLDGLADRAKAEEA